MARVVTLSRMMKCFLLLVLMLTWVVDCSPLVIPNERRSGVQSEGMASIARQQRRIQRTRETPLSQSWYKAKQQNLSKRQRAILRELWPKYGITLQYNHTLNFSALFPSHGSPPHVILDLGFGRGESLLGLASRYAGHKVVIGCELLKAGLAHCLEGLNNRSHHSLADTLDNAKVIRAEASILLRDHLASDSVSEVCLFFPDPWPQTERDGDRRLLRATTLSHLAAALRSGGRLHIATDAEAYADHCEEVIDQFNRQQQEEGNVGARWELVWRHITPPTPSQQIIEKERTAEEANENSMEDDEWRWRPSTHYERKGYAEGRAVRDLVYRLHKSSCFSPCSSFLSAVNEMPQG